MIRILSTTCFFLLKSASIIKTISVNFQNVISETEMYSEEEINAFIEVSPEIMPNISFTEEDIKTSIKEMNISSAAGLDGIPVIFLKECVDIIAGPLYSLWSKSLQCGKIAEGLKKGLVIPLYKGGAKNCIEIREKMKEQ